MPCQAPIAQRGSERNGVRPKQADTPLRPLGKGCLAPTGSASAQDLKDGVSTFELPTEEYRRNAPTPSSYDRMLPLLTGVSDEGQRPGPIRRTTTEAGAENLLSRLQSPI